MVFRMNREKLNNVVILNDIPSNIVEEAVLILKTSENADKIKEYAVTEGMDAIKNFLILEERLQKTVKIKKYFVIGFGIIFFLLLFVNMHIH